MPKISRRNSGKYSDYNSVLSKKPNEKFRKIRQFFRDLRRIFTQFPRGIGLVMTICFFMVTLCYGMILGGDWRSYFERLTASIGFSVEAITISGISKLDVSQILEELEFDANRNSEHSLLFVNAQDAKERIQKFPWVERVSIQKLYPNKLEINIKEKKAYALWQRGEIMSIIDKNGDVITDFVDLKYLNLPILIGHESQRKASEILEPLRIYPELTKQVGAYQLINRRRWDLILESGIVIRLPEENLNSTLLELVELNIKYDLFSKDISVIDLRLKDRIVFRLNDNTEDQENFTDSVIEDNFQAESET